MAFGIGKDEVTSSNLVGSSSGSLVYQGFRVFYTLKNRVSPHQIRRSANKAC